MEHPRSEADIDETLAASFPASDPPSWTLGREPAAFRIKDSAIAVAKAEATWTGKHGCPLSKALGAVPEITVLRGS